MENIIDIVGLVSCGLLLYAWIDSKISRGNGRKTLSEDEKKLRAMKDLQFAISEHIKSKR